MRSIWSGTVGFGMIVIPVKLGTVVSREDLPLHRVRRADGSRIRQQNIAEADGQPVEWRDIAMGWDTGNGQVVLVEDADLEKAYGPKNREAKILAFVPAAELPRAAHETSYYVEPAKGGEKAYELLATALARTGKAAVVSVAIRQRAALGLLYADDGYLVLERLQWASAVKKPDFGAPRTGVTDAEVSMAENLVTAMSGEFDWRAQADTSAQALEEVIRAKTETGQLVGSPTAPRPGAATAPADLAEVLRASVAAAKAAREPKPIPRKRAPRRTKEVAA